MQFEKKRLIDQKKLANRFIKLAGIKGASLKVLELSCLELDFDPEYGKIIFPSGLPSVARFVIEDSLLKLEQQVESGIVDLSDIGVTNKINLLIKSHLKILAANKQGMHNLFKITKPELWCSGSKMLWHIADVIWWLANDRSTDENHYTKRMILAKVYLKTFITFFDDDSSNHDTTWRKLDRELKQVTKFKRLKNLPYRIINKIPFIRLLQN